MSTLSKKNITASSSGKPALTAREKSRTTRKPSELSSPVGTVKAEPAEKTRNQKLIRELAFQNGQKEDRAAELIVANKELAFQNEEKEDRAAELIAANKELAFQNREKENRAAELIVANRELAFQNEEKERRAAELIVANKELAFQNAEKESRAAELIVANMELAFQNEEKEQRAAELIAANKELAFQNEEKENRAAELVLANKELAFQNEEKEKRAAELIIANKELAFQNEEKERRSAELIAANKDLAAATERELAVIRNALDVICTIDADGNFVSMNPASGKMWGYEPNELIHGSYLALVVPEDVQKTIDSVRSNMSGNALTDFENRYTHKDGSIISLMWTSHWSTSEQLMFSVAHDITERKRAEDELSNIATQLQRSNSELQDFASVASHDLQEPLRKIQAFGERLRDKCGDTLSDDGLLYLDRMQNAAGRMQTLINDLMTFARVTIMAQPFEPVDLKLIAEGVLSDLEMRIESTHGRVEIEDLGTIDADPTQMRQLLQNLIGNALKFGRPGVPPVVKVRGKTVRVKSPPDGQQGTTDTYKLTVEDNGIGFEAKYVDRIFKVFQRLHGRTEYEGTGIGLAVCRKITERHGGTISVESVPDKGTIFTVDLPVDHEEEIINEYI
jgi:PAS domain S-box-containing protein